MEIVDILEAYLVDSRQIHPLAKRQARLLSESVDDEKQREKAQIVLLLSLAALNSGATRASMEYLMKPLDVDVVKQYAEAVKEERPNDRPEWEKRLTNKKTADTVTKLLENAVTSPSSFAPIIGNAMVNKDGVYPLLMTSNQNGGCFGFSRYWRATDSLNELFKSRLEQPVEKLEEKEVSGILADVFGGESILTNSTFHSRQVAAAALALRFRFLILSGGPGTGKTSVVIQILRILVRAFDYLEPERIVLCAPTGRAKAHLGESVDRGITQLERKVQVKKSGKLLRDLSLKSLKRMTLHGVLSIRPDGTSKYGRNNPLPYQVIVVDEASMVDLHLFTTLMECAADDCRILLVGDMHQLPSVEAGAVLGDLTERFTHYDTFPAVTKDCAGWLKRVMKDVTVDTRVDNDLSSLVLSTDSMEKKAGMLADHAIILTHSYRSSTHEINRLGISVNKGDLQTALKTLTNATNNDAAVLDIRQGLEPVREWLNECYCREKLELMAQSHEFNIDAVNDPEHQDYSAAVDSLKRAFEIVNSTRILTVTNEGPRGRHAINALAYRLLRSKLDRNASRRFFHGEPVILGKNHHDLDLYNGETGMVIQPSRGGVKVVFRYGNRFSVHSLERFDTLEPAFAVTVHKAQGSEYDAVLLVLPEYNSPLLTRQIIYTGITRARQKVRILGNRGLLEKAIERREERPGGVSIK